MRITTIYSNDNKKNYFFHFVYGEKEFSVINEINKNVKYLRRKVLVF